MNASRIGVSLRKARVTAGLTQAELGRRMGTSQPAIARAESGLVEPTLDFLERFVVATGEALWLGSIMILPTEQPIDAQARIRRALGDYEPNPWRRDPSPAEQRSLESDGLTRESFNRTSG